MVKKCFKFHPKYNEYLKQNTNQFGHPLSSILLKRSCSRAEFSIIDKVGKGRGLFFRFNYELTITNKVFFLSDI